MPDYQSLAAVLAGEEYDGMSDADAADALNSPDESEPVPATLTVAGLMTLVSPPSLAKLYLRTALPAFRDDVARQDRAAVANWITLAAIAGDVTAEERDAVLVSLAATVPGPSLASRVFGVPVTAADVAHARSLA